MSSKTTVRVHDIGPSITKDELESRIAEVAASCQPWFGRRLLARVATQLTEACCRSSLAFQGHDQVATITLPNPEVKLYVIKSQTSLGGWHMDDNFRSLTVLYSPADHDFEYICCSDSLTSQAHNEQHMSHSRSW